ncbi:MAG: DUF6067 family protein [Candidatus Hydrogenedentota bacterium]
MSKWVTLYLCFAAVALPAAAGIEDAPCILYEDSYGELLTDSNGVAVWWASSGWKVSQTRPAPGGRGSALEIRAARNEAEAAQLVVRPSRRLEGFLAESTELTSETGATIPKDAVDVLRVRYVPIKKRTDRLGCEAPWPDPLPPFKGPIAIEPGKNQPLWVRVTVPQETPAGEYQGRIKLHATGYQESVPVRVVVYGFVLPEDMTCTTAFGFIPEDVFEHHQITDEAQQREILEKYWANCSAHHISVYDPAPLDPYVITWRKLEEGEGADLHPGDRALLQNNALIPEIDWSDWDKAMTRAFDHYHFNSFRMKNMPGLQNNPDRPQEIQGFEAGTRGYYLAFDAFYSKLEAHLRDKGWLDKGVLYWFDEPTKREYPFVLESFLRVKRSAPDIIRMVTEQVEPGLIGGPNLWCPLPNHYDHEKANERRAAGEHFWWYICTGPKAPYVGLFIDRPATDLRVWLWQTWERDIEGVLIWRLNHWHYVRQLGGGPQNPYEDTQTWTVLNGYKHGYGNGDGRFIYPPEAAASGKQEETVMDGPVDSIRWEMLRDGIEDYEYMAMLRRLLETKGDAISGWRRSRYEKLLDVPEDVSKTVTEFTTRPEPIEKHRDKVARAIEKLWDE